CVASAWRRKSRSSRKSRNRLTTDQVIATPVAGSTATGAWSGADSTPGTAGVWMGACAQPWEFAQTADTRVAAPTAKQDRRDIKSTVKAGIPEREIRREPQLRFCAHCAATSGQAYDSFITGDVTAPPERISDILNHLSGVMDGPGVGRVCKKRRRC